VHDEAYDAPERVGKTSEVIGATSWLSMLAMRST
jgi:hypothetical protein